MQSSTTDPTSVPSAAAGGPDAGSASAGRTRQLVAIFLVCLAGLLLEVGYTRIISYKLWYYYTYLVIGLALLGIGSGGIVVAIWKPIARATTERVVALCALFGAISIAAGYLVVAKLGLDTVQIWRYGTRASFANLTKLLIICFVLFATFIALGIIISVLLGRAREDVGKMYFADLLGAGLGCLLAIPLISAMSPPAVIMLAAVIFAVVAVMMAAPPGGNVVRIAGAAVALVLVAGVVVVDDKVKINLDATKIEGGPGVTFSDWGPVFRVDVVEVPSTDQAQLLLHDGTYGSGIHRFNGNPEEYTEYETEPRGIPFDVLGAPPERTLIIGAAGGNEILASLHFEAKRIEAVELNPVTVGILRRDKAEYTGYLPEQPGVSLHNADGRSYLARSDRDYDLIWYVAPDSYAANNAASMGAFVLSESYLYTVEMIEQSLEHLTGNGLMVQQFGELDFAGHPNRTARYVATVREALGRIGVENPEQHIAVAVLQTPDAGDLSTIIVKRTPFTPGEAERLIASTTKMPGVTPVYVPGAARIDHVVADLSAADNAGADAIVEGYGNQITPVFDDAPFFWHFHSFKSVLANYFESVDVRDPEQAIGERVLVLLLAIAVLYAGIFLILPFVAIRDTWRRLPRKGVSAAYFACLGLGFMLFEISLIQRLTKLLGYPTYSLTVTLAALLVSTGVGAYLSPRLRTNPQASMWKVFGALVVLAIFYRFALDPITDALLPSSLGVRVGVTLLLLVPLGLCLGMFMPLGLGAVSDLAPDDGDIYVAWSWAINGFFSVIGSVLTTILAMSFGFRWVQAIAVVIYALAVAVFARLVRAESAPA